MTLPNIFTAELPPDAGDPPGFRNGSLRVSQALGATELSAQVVQIEPGEHLCPYHYEYVEEWLLVVAGEADVRTPEGTRRLQAGQMMAFPAGPDGAHRVSASPDAPARVLMFSRNVSPEVCVYPDSDKLAVYTNSGQDEVMVRRGAESSHLEYFDGESA